jgi:hypothetical protein
MAKPTMEEMIGGTVQEKDLIGTALADWLQTTGQKALTGSVKAVGDWWARSSADQEGIHDDLLRLVAGGVRNTTNAWKAGTADQEGIHDDFLRGVGWTVGKGMQALDAGSYYGGKLGGNIARMVGVDPRLGGAAGNILGDVVFGGAVAKTAQIGKTTSRLRRLRALNTPEIWIEGAAKGRYALAHGDKPVGLIDDFATAVTATGKQRRNLKTLEKAVSPKAFRTVDFQKVPASRRRDKIGKYFDDIYTEGMSDAEKYTFLEAASFGGQAEKQGQKFVKSVAGTHRHLFGGSAHHFGIDLGLAGDTLNRSDAKEIVKYLNDVDIYPGNHPNNYIMAYHDYSQQISNAQKAVLMDKGMPLAKADQFLKKTPQTKDLGIKELGDLHEGQVMDELQKLTKVKRRNWRSKGVDPKELDLPPAFIGTDHQQFIHGIGDKLPKRQELIRLAKTDAWLELSPREAAKRITEVVREQQNVALNVNKLRLQKVMKAMKFDPANQDWIDIQIWMIQNPRHAAHLDWYKTAKKGIGLSIEELTADVSYNEAEFIAKIFNLEKVPQTGKKIRKFEYGFPNEIDEIRKDMRINNTKPSEDPLKSLRMRAKIYN